MTQVGEDCRTRIQSYMRVRKDAVDGLIQSHLPTPSGPARRLFEAMAQFVRAGGKRFRPILVTAATDFVAGRAGWDEESHDWWRRESAEREAALLYAAAVEYIHTYSLIHDDLPCMDDDDMRRGMPTCHVAHGEVTALLAGDALNTDAFALLARVQPEFHGRALQAAGELARAAGTGGMVAGQMADMEATGAGMDRGQKAREGEGRAVSETVSREELLGYIHKHKTAALIRAALAGGALMAGAEPRDLELLSSVGERVGLLFQVVDDILDVTSDTATLGKTAGRDQDLDKLTYPALIGLDAARGYSERLAREALDLLETAGDRARLLSALVRQIASRSS